MAKKDEKKVEEAKKALEAAEAKKSVKDDKNLASLIEEANELGIRLPRISPAVPKDKDPAKIAKEQVRVDKQFIHSLESAIAKHKANAKMKPIEKKRGVLVARLKAVKSRNRAHTYTDANIRAFLEELELIDRNPKSWNKVTVNGTKPYTPSNKKKKTARDILDGMDLED